MKIPPSSITGRILVALVATIITMQIAAPAHAKIVFKNEYLIEENGTEAFVIDSGDDVSGDLILQFGNTLSESLTWDTANTLFQLSDDFYVENTVGIGASPAASKDLYIESLLPSVLLSDTNPTSGNRLRFDIIGTSSWFSSSWSDRKKITIDNTEVSGSSDLTDFPVLYSVGADAELAAGAQADGDDILFTGSDGITQLSHEIEDYDSGTGTLYAWVKVPTLSATLDTEIYMYYGNGAAVNQEDAENVWNSNYAAVYHLEEVVTDEGSTAAAHIDSTSNNNDMAQEGNDDIGSQIYQGQDFDGTDDYTKATGSNSYRITGDVTLETWLYRDNSTNIHDLIDTQGPTGSEAEASNHLYEFIIGTDDTLLFEWEYGAGSNEIVTATTPVVTANQNWVHLSATRDVTANEIRFYENGVQLGTTVSYTNDPTGGTVDDLDLGRQGGAGSDYLDGRMDEVRISNIRRSDDWLLTGFNNMNTPGTFASAGAEESFVTGKGMIGSVNAIPFHILTDDTERITVASTGEVGIGTTNPTSPLDIAGNSMALDSDNTGVGADVDIIANQGSDNDGTLRYNATANEWELSNDGGAFQAIGTRVPDLHHYIDTTGDSVVSNNNTTDYWDEGAENGTQHPNLTPSATTSEVLVMMNVSFDPNGTADESDVVRIERNIGSDPTCGSSTQVGDQLGWLTSDNDVDGASAIYVDNPATTSQVFYTLCSDAESTDTGGTILEIQFTLYEINDASDLAEVYATNDSSLTSGDVVSFDSELIAGVKKSEKAYDSKVLGVVSSKPAETIGGTGGEGVTGVPIALTGRVPIKVSIENGLIYPGDLLAPSSIPGVAMKATRAGYIIGRAFGSYTEKGIGMVLGFVGTHYANPERID